MGVEYQHEDAVIRMLIPSKVCAIERLAEMLKNGGKCDGYDSRTMIAQSHNFHVALVD